MKSKTLAIDVIIDEEKLNNALKDAYGDEYDKWPEGTHWFMVRECDKHFFKDVDTRPLDVDIFTKDTLYYRLKPDTIRAAGYTLDEGFIDKLKALAESY